MLAGAAAWIAGCGLRGAPEALAEATAPVVLGWRWVPGLELSYRCHVQRAVAGTVVRRLEAWTYLVRDLDREGVASLEGRLVGFGAGLERQGAPVPEASLEAARAVEAGTSSTAHLRLGMGGALVSCEPSSFSRGWPHRALALRLPERPMAVHDEWPDPELVRPFASLLPLSMDVHLEGRTRLAGLDAGSGTTLATLASEGRVGAPGGLAIQVQALGTWDADRGVLLERVLRAWPQPGGGEGGPGRLEVRLSLD